MRHCPKKEPKQRKSDQQRRDKRNPTWQRNHVQPAPKEAAPTQTKQTGNLTETDPSQADPGATSHTPTPEADAEKCPPTLIEVAQTPTKPSSPNPDPTLLPNDVNFSQLQSPSQATPITPLQQRRTPEATSPINTFVWRLINAEGGGSATDKGKEKMKLGESTPLTRQGYRSGQLAEDLWIALGMPNVP